MSFLGDFVSSAKDAMDNYNKVYGNGSVELPSLSAGDFWKPIGNAIVDGSNWMMDNYNKVYGNGGTEAGQISDRMMAEMITGERSPENIIDIIKHGFNDAAIRGDIDIPSSLADGQPTAASPSYSRVKASSTSGRSVDYLNADLAKHYGMDAKTAYGEALQNTAYQRAVADLKAAGLNPVLAAGNISPSGSFVAGNTLKGGSGSGSSGAASSNSGKYAMSSNLYNAIGAAASIIGAVVGFKNGHGAFRWMNAATVSQLSKNLVQSAIQGYGSLFGSK